MADNVTLPGAGSVVATDDDGTAQHQYTKVEWGPNNTFNKVDIASGMALPIQVRSSTGEDVIKHEDDASANADPGIVILAMRQATPANTSGTDGDYEPLRMIAGRQVVRGEGRFVQATFGTITRPANTTAYSANDAVSNNATAGSVTSQTATVADTNDDPVSVERIRLATTDTGPATAGAQFQAWVFNSDPTANSGVGGGDNAAFSQKQAGLVGTLTGTFFSVSDGSFAVLTPDAGVRAIAKPVSGAATLYILLKTLTAFTPSANSTTFIATLEGFQGRA